MSCEVCGKACDEVFMMAGLSESPKYACASCAGELPRCEVCNLTTKEVKLVNVADSVLNVCPTCIRENELPKGWIWEDFGVIEKKMPDGRVFSLTHPQVFRGFDDSRWNCAVYTSHEAMWDGANPQKQWFLAARRAFDAAFEAETVEPFIISYAEMKALPNSPELLSNARRLALMP